MLKELVALNTIDQIRLDIEEQKATHTGEAHGQCSLILFVPIFKSLQI